MDELSRTNAAINFANWNYANTTCKHSIDVSFVVHQRCFIHSSISASSFFCVVFSCLQIVGLVMVCCSSILHGGMVRTHKRTPFVLCIGFGQYAQRPSAHTYTPNNAISVWHHQQFCDKIIYKNTQRTTQHQQTPKAHESHAQPVQRVIHGIQYLRLRNKIHKENVERQKWWRSGTTIWRGRRKSFATSRKQWTRAGILIKPKTHSHVQTLIANRTKT